MADNVRQNEEYKPAFTISQAQIFLNLHNAAVEKAAAVVNLNSKDVNINQFIINSGCSDGKNISERMEKALNEQFTFNDMEFGIVLEVPDLEIAIPQSFSEKHKLDATDTDIKKSKEELKETQKQNVKIISKFKELILQGINEYFKWFAGKDVPDFSEKELVPFIPDYNAGNVQVSSSSKSCLIEAIDEDMMASILSYYVEDPQSLGFGKPDPKKYKKILEEIKENPNYTVRIGYKVGYSIDYRN